MATAPRGAREEITMDLAGALAALNPWAVLAAALSSFLIGGLWYSPALFSRAWMAANGFTEENLERGSPPAIFGGAFLLALVAAVALAMFLGPEADLAFGLAAGALVGVAWVATSFGTTYLFERRPLGLWLVNAGYHAVTFTAMGAILGAWR